MSGLLQMPGPSPLDPRSASSSTLHLQAGCSSLQACPVLPCLTVWPPPTGSLCPGSPPPPRPLAVEHNPTSYRITCDFPSTCPLCPLSLVASFTDTSYPPSPPWSSILQQIPPHPCSSLPHPCPSTPFSHSLPPLGL